MMRLPHGIVLDSLHRVMTAQYPIDPTDAAHLKKESWAVFSPCDCAYTPGLAGAQAGVLQALPQVDIETAADLQRCQQSCEDSFDEAIASTSHVSRPADADALPTQHDDHERQRSHSEASTSDAVTYAESSPNRDGAIAEDLDERGSGGRTVGAGEQYRNGAVPFVTRRAASSSSREGQLTHARGVAEVTVVCGGTSSTSCVLGLRALRAGLCLGWKLPKLHRITQSRMLGKIKHKDFRTEGGDACCSPHQPQSVDWASHLWKLTLLPAQTSSSMMRSTVARYFLAAVSLHCSSCYHDWQCLLHVWHCSHPCMHCFRWLIEGSAQQEQQRGRQESDSHPARPQASSQTRLPESAKLQTRPEHLQRR